MAADEFITEISWPFLPLANTHTGLYKVSQRRDLDISCVSACFVFEMSADEIKGARIVLGGVAASPLRLAAIENEMRGQKISKAFVATFKKSIASAIAPLTDARGTSEFRVLVTQELFAKFMHEKFQL
jgi:xanthine dehydrogenase small subunit